jgi:hypothetical protein
LSGADIDPSYGYGVYLILNVIMAITPLPSGHGGFHPPVAFGYIISPHRTCGPKKLSGSKYDIKNVPWLPGCCAAKPGRNWPFVDGYWLNKVCWIA